MTSMELLELMGSIRDQYVVEARMEISPPRRLSLKRAVLIAAVITLTLVLVGCGVAYAQGWFTDFYAQKNKAPLTQGQADYIVKNEQVINQGQTRNGWTVELRSAINDGSTAYIIIGVTAPEGFSLEPEVVDDHLEEWFDFGNHGLHSVFMNENIPWFLTTPPGTVLAQTFAWEDDGDGILNTKNYVIQLTPQLDLCKSDPFAPGAEYKIHIENIVREYDDEEYKQELLNGKYAGQDGIMFEQEEIKRMWRSDVLAEGTWDFTVTFAQSQNGIELLSKPVYTMAYAYREGALLNEFLHDTVVSHEKVKITSFVLSPLSAVITYECDAGCNFTDLDKEHIYAVMKDGSQIELLDYGGGGINTQPLTAASPLVLAEVDHILMPDGTKIPMPK